MPRPKNYAFEKAQRERARLARKAARKDARTTLRPDGTEDPDAVDVDPDAPVAEGEKDTDPDRG
ncbi:MAG: hypothetical protein ABR587_07040 [Candidatus Binatia bacterium]